ncbi:YdgH/BhsA/McbA-like domain containing protein [Rahnella selenatireducens]|uniref:YdgH/BhsA/McbA-like domain containing protein n=1 Tax=Rahnella selenatireducens TaxID=3389797 RepID=UPI00396878B2
MKSNKIIIAAVLAGFFSVNAMAADLITKEEAKEKGYTSLGVVTTTNEYTAPMDAREELAKLADEKGGKYFVIIAAQEKRKISATAEVFK